MIELLWAFFQIGLFSIGGGYAAMPLIKAQIVDKYAWLSMAEFTDLVTISEMTPGPIALNAASFVGLQVAGFKGAIVASLGNIIPSFVIVSLLAYIYSKYKNLSAMQAVLNALRPAVVALIATAGISILVNALQVEVAYLNLGIIIVGFVAMRKYKLNPVHMIFISGFVGIVFELVF